MFVIRGSTLDWASLVGCSSLYLHAAVRGAVISVTASPPLPVHRCALRARRQVASLQLTFEHPADHPALYQHRRTSYHRAIPLRGRPGGGHLAIPSVGVPARQMVINRNVMTVRSRIARWRRACDTFTARHDPRRITSMTHDLVLEGIVFTQLPPVAHRLEKRGTAVDRL